MKTFTFHASVSNYLTLSVKAPNLEAAKKIAENSCGSEWESLESGEFVIDHDLTEEEAVTANQHKP